MTKPTTNRSLPDRLRRVLVVLDPTGPYEPALAIAHELIGRLGVDGVGLLLRDEDVLRAGSHSLAQEVQRVPIRLATGPERSAEQQLRARVSQIERQIGDRSRRLKQKWTVQIDSGMHRDVVLRTARDGDFLILAEDTRGPTAYARLAAELMDRGDRPLMVVPGTARSVRSVQVVYEESAAGHRALTLARNLAAQGGLSPVAVIVPGVADRAPLDLSERLGSYFAEVGVSTVVLRQPHLSVTDAAQRLDAKDGVLILPASAFRAERESHVYALRMLCWPYVPIA